MNGYCILLAKPVDYFVVEDVIGKNWAIKGVDAGEQARDVVELAQKATKQLFYCFGEGNQSVGKGGANSRIE